MIEVSFCNSEGCAIVVNAIFIDDCDSVVGSEQSVNVDCNNDVPYCLLNQFDIENGGDGTPSIITGGGEWYFVQTDPSGDDPVVIGGSTYLSSPGTGTQLPGVNPCVEFLGNGIHHFRYRIPDDCNPSNQFLDQNFFVTVSGCCEGTATVNTISEPCAFEIRLEHPDNGTNEYRITNIIDSTAVRIEVDCVVDSCDGEENRQEINFEGMRTIRRYTNSDGANLQLGGFIEEIVVYDNLSGASTTIVLDPVDVAANNPSWLTGINSADLYFDPANHTVFQAALNALIINALNDLFGTGTFQLSIGVSSSGVFNIGFTNRHVIGTTNQWVGLETIGLVSYDVDGAGTLENTSTIVEVNTGALVTCEYLAPCGNLSYLTSLDPVNALDTANSVYNNIIILPNVFIGPNTSSQTTCSITQTTYTVTVANCTNPVYQWQELIGFTWTDIAGETTDTLVYETTNSIRVVVTCDECEIIGNA